MFDISPLFYRDLSSNLLNSSTLSTSIFAGVFTQMQTLNLGNNLLTTIASTYFAGITTITNLYVTTTFSVFLLTILLGIYRAIR